METVSEEAGRVEFVWGMFQAEDTGVGSREDNPSALLWSTFIGGSSADGFLQPSGNRTLALDASGNPVVVGVTASSDFPTTPGVYDVSYNGGSWDGFVTKLSSDGSALLWSTFLGGSEEEICFSIVIDGSGRVIVTGETASSDFPTTIGAYDESYNGGNTDCFVVKLSSDGSALLWSTFLGGIASDFGMSVVLDASGNPVVTGRASSNFPSTPGAYDESWNGAFSDGFVAKLSSGGSDLLWGTFLGGSGWDEGHSVVLDASGNPVVTGLTQSSDFPTTPGAFDGSYNSSTDGFVSKLSSDGSDLLWSTFLGGDGGDIAIDIVLDGSGSPVVIGYTTSGDFPRTSGGYDPGYNGDGDTFVSKFSSDGSELLWGTFLGGTGEDYGSILVLDPSGDPVVTGRTESTDFPTTAGAYDESHNGSFDVFVAELSSDGSDLLWSTFLGGDDNDFSPRLVLDVSGNPVVMGGTASSDFPTTRGAYDGSHNGSSDIFVAKLLAMDPASVTIPRGGGLTSPLEVLNNPSSGGHVVRLELTQETRAQVGIYDLRGRRVRLLMSGRREAGGYGLRWDGRDDAARTVPSGVYWVKALVNGQEQRRSLVLLR
jgi:hypothetical protein